jgi:hypothetical protein
MIVFTPQPTHGPRLLFARAGDADQLGGDFCPGAERARGVSLF